MRVNYTLPGLLPMDPSPAEVARPGDSPFRARLGVAPAPQWLNWRSLLGLEHVPVNATTIEPPPRPADYEPSDALTTRMTWRRMLDRHVEALSQDQPRPDTQAVERMLALLTRFREDEDEVTARHLAEAEE